jgi:hypothetical protein
MIRQTLAMFVDGYRELRAKRMFGLALAASLAVMAAFACIGVNDRSLSVLRWNLPVPFVSPMVLYKYAFVYGIVGFWLAFGATAMALTSVASVFPDFLSGGSVELYLARPMSRLRLFITKYVSGLVFVLLQMVVFAVAAYFILGIRGGVWRASVFLSIPIVVCYFSYLYCLITLFGVWTRSTIASLILTLICWVLMWGIQSGERIAVEFIEMARSGVALQDRRIESAQQFVEKLTAPVNGEPTPTSSTVIKGQLELLENLKVERQRQQDNLDQLETAHDYLYLAATIFPKTDATSTLLDRFLVSDEDVQAWMSTAPNQGRRGFENPNEPQIRPGGGPNSPPPPSARETERSDYRARRQAAHEEATLAFRNRPISWIVGTSLIFEAVVLCLAAWIFCRRDY